MTSGSNVQTSDWTIGRLLNWTTDFLTRQGVEEARLSAELLLANAGECRRIDLYARFERTLPEAQLARFREAVKRAAKHEPIAYLIGEKEFFSLSFAVTPDVLIPRPETETLVEACIDFFHSMAGTSPAPIETDSTADDSAQPDVLAADAAGHARSSTQPPVHRLLDIGTGSGCIAIACLANLAAAEAVATDISQAALDVARKNAERHGVLDRLQFVQADRLKLPAELTAGGFDVILCNPPYVPADEVPRLHPGVREFEPRGALTDETHGLSLYGDLAAHAPSLLRPTGRVYVEVGDGQATAVTNIMSRSGKGTRIALRKDRVTGRERVLGFAAC